MKNSLFLVLLLSATTAVNGQITYDHTHYAQVGDSVLLSSCALDALVPGPSGEGVTWDFSNVEAIAQSAAKFVDPNSAGYKQSWCFLNGQFFNCDEAFDAVSNIAQADPDTMPLEGNSVSNIVDHYMLSEQGLDYSLFGFTIGSEDGSFPIGQQYENYDRRIPFPMTYDTRDTSDGNYVLDGNDFGFPLVQIFSIHRENHVDAYGSLSTPYGEFAQTIRLRSITNRIDSILTETDTTAIPTNEVTYQWFSTDFKVPLLTITALLTDSGEFVSGVEYVDSLRCLTPIADFVANATTITVDSASTTAEISFYNFSQNGTNFTWDFGDSTGSGAKNPAHTFVAGSYDVALVVNNEVCEPVQSDTTWQTILVEPFVTAGLFEEHNSRLHLFPNPVQGTLNFDQALTGSFQIVDGIGRRELTGRLDHSTQLVVDRLQSGIHFFILEQGHGKAVTPFLVK